VDEALVGLSLTVDLSALRTTVTLSHSCATVLMLADLVAAPDKLLSLAPEELAQFLLAELVARGDKGDTQLLNRHNFFSWLHRELANGRIERAEQVMHSFAEAWSWLQNENLTVTEPSQGPEWVFVSDRGRRAASPEGFAALNNSHLLPKGTLHPVLVQKVWPTFIRGDYDTTVFHAFPGRSPDLHAAIDHDIDARHVRTLLRRQE